VPAASLPAGGRFARLGATGMLSSLSNIAPKLVRDLYGCCRTERYSEARDHQTGLAILHRLIKPVGVPGVKAANVVVLGGGVVGTNAIRVAMGMEAQVTVIDRSLPRLKELDFQFGGRLNTIYSTVEAIEYYVAEADLVIGAVLVPGAAAPRLVSREMVREMRDRSVVVDVAIDQGGCFETAHATTHSKPTYVEEGVVHYCVANMPGAVARTSTFALNNATLPYVLALADKGYRQALLDDPGLLEGLNIHRGKVTYEAVATALGHEYTPARRVLGT